MKLEQIEGLLSQISGCTFASLDSATRPSAGIRRVVEGERVILFTNKKSSGYDNMVRRRLSEVGRDPDGFVLGDLPWGERVENTPLIVHNGKYYLQTILLAPGKIRAFIGAREVDWNDLTFLHRKTANGQGGLPGDKQVVVSTYALDGITGIRLMGEEVLADLGKFAKSPDLPNEVKTTIR